MPNYILYRVDRVTRGGGLCVYAKSNLNLEILKDSSFCCEQLWIKLTLKKKKVAIGVIYRPPSTDIPQFLNEFEDILGKIYPVVDEVICAGDFNIDLLNLNSKVTDSFTEILESFKLKQIMDCPTRISKSTSTLLDLIIMNEKILINKGTFDTNGTSDHLGVFCEVALCDNIQNNNKIIYRNFSNFDDNAFQMDLFSVPFYNIFDFDSVDDKVDYFVRSLIDLFDRHAPIRVARISKPMSPWLTGTIELMIKIRNNALNKYKRTKSDIHLRFYRDMRNYVNKAIKREKRAYFLHKFNSIDNKNSKETWKVLKVNSCLPGGTRVIPEQLRNPDAINDYFINSVITDSSVDDFLKFYKNSQTLVNKFCFKEVDELFIFNTIIKIKTNAVGSDDLNIKLIRLCCPHVIPYITHIINFCLINSVFPTAWRGALVHVLPKKPSPTEYKDLRAISILPTLSKILERAMELQLKEYLDRKTLLPKFQSGFRKNYSCTTALLSVVDDIVKQTDIGNCTVLILLDLSRAFDTINHDLLLSILKYIGISDKANDLIENFLKNRTQQVVLDNNLKSNVLSLKFGVPQGSILGPLLFNIYSANLITSCQYCKVHCYADDTQLYYSFPFEKLDVASALVNKELEEFTNRANGHGLIINPNKSNIIFFGPKNKLSLLKEYMKISINGNVIPVSNEAKNLGVIMDSQLRFERHITVLIQRSYAAIKAIYGVRDLLTIAVKSMLCEALVLSNFNYASCVYGPFLTTNSKRKIQKVQNSCLRLIYGIRKFQRISHKLKETSWLNMENRRTLQSLCFFHKLLIFKCPPYLYEKLTFRTDVHNINIRCRGRLTHPQFKTELFKRGFTYQICKLYNSVPDDTKKLSISNFKLKCWNKLYQIQCT